jgi:drug/metabolite transporter, DME family
VLAVLAVVAAALCFSTTGTAQALAGTGASPVAVGAARVLVGGAVLAVAGSWGRRSLHDRPRPADGRRRPTWVVVLVGSAGVLAYQPTFFIGATANGVAVATVVTLGAAPVATGVLDAIRSRSAPARRWFVATGLALLGVVLVSGILGADLGSISVGGLAASASAGVAYGVYTVAAKVLIDRGWTPRSTMAAMFGAAGAASLPILLVVGATWILTPRGAGLALWLGLVTTAAAYLLFGWGLARLPATTVATVSLAEPLSAALLGVVVLHERLGPAEMVGMGLIVAALLLVGAGTGLPRRVTAGRTRTALLDPVPEAAPGR